MLPLSSWHIRDSRVLDAIRTVPRGSFVPREQQEYAEEDRPLPIGSGQTISQPYIVAYMSEALQVHKECRVLEVGTGSGYQAAVLSLLARQVYSIERIHSLYTAAGRRLGELGYTNVLVRYGDGAAGWPEEAPFDRIIITAAMGDLPETLAGQLVTGGYMVYPRGSRRYQSLELLHRTGEDSFSRQILIPVIFVPFLRGTA